MEDSEKLQEIMANYCPFEPSDIDLSEVIKDKYVAEEFKIHLAHDICSAWPDLDETKIHNELFDEIKTGEDILELLENE